MTKIKSYKNGYIFVTPSLIMGMGSVLNVAGNYFPFVQASSPEEADCQAIESDWGVVGNDILLITEKTDIGDLKSAENK